MSLSQTNNAPSDDQGDYELGDQQDFSAAHRVQDQGPMDQMTIYPIGQNQESRSTQDSQETPGQQLTVGTEFIIIWHLNI